MKLNLGSGTFKLDGWENVDLPEVDLSVFPWPWADGSADEILASHILEHFDRMTGENFLIQCHRVLVPGGKLHIAVPDMDKFIDCRLAEDFSPLGGYKWTDLNHFMGGDSTEHQQQNLHRYMYCFASLAWILQGTGFKRIEYRNRPAQFDNPKYALISLYVDAVK